MSDPADQIPAADEPTSSVTVDELVAVLRVAIAKGLPLKEAQAGVLLDLWSVYARAVVPREPASRLAALNDLLPRLIASIGDSVYREAVQQLFGLFPGSRGTTLTNRRRLAADSLGYSVGHFREEIEGELLQAVAGIVKTDLLRYQARVKRAAASIEPTGDTPRLGPEHLTHEEELISRIWSRVYALRAELIAVARLSDTEGLESQVEDHRQAALREEETLQDLLGEYTQTYGKSLMQHGEVEFSMEALERLAGWRL